MPMKVDLMIVGAQKCATTTLFALLDTHPGMQGCRNKEPHFFSTAKDWRRELPRYHALFDQRPGALYFEASTSYSFHPLRNPDLWDDLYAYNPELRIVYIVRRPLDRIVSGYMHTYERGYTDLPLEAELRQNPFHLQVTRYATQIGPYIRRFGADRVLVLDFDDLLNDRDGVLRRTADLMGIDPAGFDTTTDKHLNVSVGGGKWHYKWDHPNRFWRGVRRFAPPIWRRLTDNSARAFHKKPELPPALQAELMAELAPEIDAMEAILGKDLGHWRTS
ncbi:MAG: sulfotransferase [Flavobacteriales bacterium]|nr:sulfotransferase [Flavobacteriales bacterium]